MDSSPQSPPTIPARKGNLISKILAVVAIIVMGLIFLGQKTMMGKRYKVSEMESVNYSGKATEDDAKKLGEILKGNGYFGGTHVMDVLLKKDDQGTVLSFVLNERWSDQVIIDGFREVGTEIAAKGFGKPLTIKLIDPRLNTKNEIKIE